MRLAVVLRIGDVLGDVRVRQVHRARDAGPTVVPLGRDGSAGELSPCKLNSALPCKSFVPLLVMTLMTPPVAPPNSARVAARLDLDFFDEVGDDVLARDAALEVRRLDAVDDVAVLAGARAVDRQPAELRFVVGAGRLRDERREVAALREQVDLLARMFVCRALCLTSTSGDSAVTCTDSVTPASASARSTFLIWPRPTDDVCLLLRGEALQRGGHLVGARGDGREAVDALGVSGGGQDGAGARLALRR